jgi:hypothetical protein
MSFKTENPKKKHPRPLSEILSALVSRIWYKGKAFKKNQI